MNKRASVRDVARQAGVSIGSVSRVMNGGPNVSADLRARVEAAAAQLEYRANAHARGLRLGTSRMIGCMVAELRNPIYASIVGAVESQLHEQGYMLLLSSSRGDMQRELDVLGFFESRGVDGIIATPSLEGQAFADSAFGRSRTPMVIVDREVGDSHDAVMVDQGGGVHQAVAHLLALGHRRIALFTAGMGLWSGRSRSEGYHAAHEEAGVAVDPQLIRPVKDWDHSSFDDMAALLRGKAPPTAVIAPGTRVLSGALRAVRAAGLTVPRDISAIALGPTDALEFADPELVTVAWDMASIGKLASDLLLERLAGVQGAPTRRIMVPTSLQAGASCAPPPLTRRAHAKASASTRSSAASTAGKS